MKKNISINISGIIFHIEEDGYEILRKYLDSINRYFSSFEDNSEILADIESRIAEILLSKLSEGKQVVTADDVNSLMATMGSVNDFKAAEEQEIGGAAAGAEQKQYRQQSSTTSEQPIASKKLFRDEKRKMLGGVCAGLAHYFNIDPLWPRLIFALLALASYGGIFIVYILLWIFIPATDTLEEPVAAKKMYRDKDNRVIGGVASGLAAYWNIDITVARVLFICFMFLGGVGFIVYIIMWIALPEARTITERMQMQGERVTLSNIESSVKKGLNEKDGTEESVFAKIILFPFRLIAAVIDGLAKILGPVFLLIVDIFRIGIGLCITLTGAFTIFALILAFGIIMGFFHAPTESVWNDWYWTQPDFPIETFSQTFPIWMAILAFVVAFVPALMIALLGASIIAKKIVFNSYVGWTMFVLFFVGAGVLSFTIPKVVLSFKEEGEYKVEKIFSMKGTPVLRMNETGLDDYHVTELNLRGYDGKELKLIQRFESQGSSRREAVDNAQMIEYRVVQADSVVTFDSNITFKKDAKFRAQRLEMELYVPINAPFIIEGDMWRLIDYYRGDYYRDREENQTWKMNERGELECQTCYKTSSDDSEDDSDRGDRSEARRDRHDEFGLHDFNSIDLEGIFDVTVEQGDEWVVNLEGSSSDKDHYRIYVSGETLVIDHDEDVEKFWRRREEFEDHQVRLFVTMPALRDIEARGLGKLRFRGFEEPELDVELSGIIVANAGIDARDLNIEINGLSSLDLAGTGSFLEADITGGANLSAYGFETKEAILEVHGASTAKVYVTEKLEISKGITSSVHHRGSPRIIREN